MPFLYWPEACSLPDEPKEKKTPTIAALILGYGTMGPCRRDEHRSACTFDQTDAGNATSSIACSAFHFPFSVHFQMFFLERDFQMFGACVAQRSARPCLHFDSQSWILCPFIISKKNSLIYTCIRVALATTTSIADYPCSTSSQNKGDQKGRASIAPKF